MKYIIGFLIGYCVFFTFINIAHASDYQDAKKDRCFDYYGTLVCQATPEVKEEKKIVPSEDEIFLNMIKKLLSAADKINNMPVQDDSIKVTVTMEEE